MKLISSGWDRRIGPDAAMTFRKAQRSVLGGVGCGFVFIFSEGIFAGLAIRVGAILSPLWLLMSVGFLSYNIVAQRRARRQAGIYLNLSGSLWKRVPLRYETEQFDEWIIKHSTPGNNLLAREQKERANPVE